MDAFKSFTYWFVAINLITSVLFMLVAGIFGARDFLRFMKVLKNAKLMKPTMARRPANIFAEPLKE